MRWTISMRSDYDQIEERTPGTSYIFGQFVFTKMYKYFLTINRSAIPPRRLCVEVGDIDFEA